MQRVSVARGEKTVLHEIDLQIGVGEHVAILGPNGCGKSTLIKTINRECYPLLRDGSSLTLMGRENWNVFELRSLLGIVSNDLAATCTRDFKGREIVLSGFFSSIGLWPYYEVTPEMEAKADAILDRLRAAHLADRWLDELSSGEVRRLVIGRALVHDPKALLLDEPSTSLDLFAQQELRDILRQLAREGIGIVLVTHHLSDIIPEIDRVVLLHEGKVLKDGPKEQVLTEPILSEAFGVPVTISQRDGLYNCW
ncbi:MAG TPA: ATP-binding cassette domain-containing protein [Bryobacteraceae bacterium]|jgi:iron complex transport system ATP-binding protein|nr:ATP-binding cassette domain-containing protein [Bryobacteraceae bacterium]